MNINSGIEKVFSWGIIVLGAIACGYSVLHFEPEKVDSGLIALAFATVFLGPFFQFQLPHREIHFSLTDSLVFYAIIMYNPPIAVILSLFGPLSASLSFRQKEISIKKQTIFLNLATSAITTLAAGSAVWGVFSNELRDHNFSHIFSFVGLLSFIAITHFVINSILLASFTAIKNHKSFWKAWNESYLNSFVRFFVAGAITGLMIKALERIDPVLLLVTVVIGGVSFVTYRRYINDLQEAVKKVELVERERAEQAERHIEDLLHYIREQEQTTQELRESRERFRHAAFHDSLTNLPNRNLFLEKLKLRLEKLKHQPKKKFAVLSLDLNRFKIINESLGHSVGDRLILHVARRLCGLMREGDVVARFSGDEFGIILNDLQIADDAVQFAELIEHKILAPFFINGRQVFTSVSIGIVVGNSGYENAEDILRDANIAMYHAKKNDKSYLVFDQKMYACAVTLLQLETDLRHAVDRNEITVYYQPVVDLTTLKLIGFEALMRWNHPQRGLVSPGEFIQLAEETGLIIPLTLWTLQKACLQLVEWQKEQLMDRPLMMSINLSGKMFARLDIVEQVRKIIIETGINPARLKLEITESAVMENAEGSIYLLKQLRSLGIQVSIDDFGTGYSSLSYLHRFPIDMLKVDRSFVSTMEDGSENGEIVRTIISLAKTLKLGVVAEGIETIHQLHQLRILGCDYGQGYLFSRPLSAEEIGPILKNDSLWQKIISGSNPAVSAQNLEFKKLRIVK